MTDKRRDAIRQPSGALRWHLEHNVFPPVTTRSAQEGIQRAIDACRDGRDEEIAVGDLTHAEIVEDLRLWEFVSPDPDPENVYGKLLAVNR